MSASGTTLILGLGASALAMVSRLRELGQPVRLYSDQAPNDPQVQTRLNDLGVETFYGGNCDLEQVLSGISLIAPSPAFAPHHHVLRAATAQGIPIVSEPELAWRLHRGHTRLVGVTGTNGKTTTTQLIGAGMRAAFGPVPLLGNIGVPLTEGLHDDLAMGVLELSSFQLHYADTLACEVAVVTNIADDHLTWHSSADDYAQAKAKIWMHAETIIVNVHEPRVLDLLEAYPPTGKVVLVNPDTFTLPIQLLGAHNRANAALAQAACMAMGADQASVDAALIAQGPDAHRMQYLGKYNGVVFINDSKATNPHAAIAAITELERVHWIIGGDTKGVALDELIPWMQGHAHTIYAIGTSHAQVAQLAQHAGIPVVEDLHLETVFPELTKRIRPGDTVLLSPAAASTDQFTGYAQRGELFTRLVQDYATA